MKSRLLSVITLLVTAIIMSACVTTSYRTLDGKAYKNRDEAWAASTRINEEAEAAVSSGVKPLVDRKILFVMPTASALLRTAEARVVKQGKTYAQPGTPVRSQEDFFVDMLVANLKSQAASLKKANIYQDVVVQDVDSTEPNIQPSATQDVVSFYLGEGAPIQYFQSAKYGKQVVSTDMGKASLGERRRSFIDDIKSKALQ